MFIMPTERRPSAGGALAGSDQGITANDTAPSAQGPQRNGEPERSRSISIGSSDGANTTEPAMEKRFTWFSAVGLGFRLAYLLPIDHAC